MWFWNIVASGLQILAAVFVVTIGVTVLAAAIMFVVDRVQTKDAVRRNYPVLGRFRHLFTELGEFFRQYFFAQDREEMPFNRAQRNWIGRAAAGESNTIAFGSTRNITVTGTPIFVNAPFPPLDQDFASTEPLQIGPFCK
ncbi:MAG: FMN-binding glutamate synthase family protein, partial [Pseudomonadota bacterium]